MYLPENLLLKYTIYFFNCIIVILAVLSLENYVTSFNPKVQFFLEVSYRF
jgi:hypothetical protein